MNYPFSHKPRYYKSPGLATETTMYEINEPGLKGGGFTENQIHTPEPALPKTAGMQTYDSIVIDIL